ncbi:Outer envelope pore protein 24A [Nymphaea thermarum]|nr:Outer envelope pore protein 24A [Nymphaea thermarum]
MSAKSFISSSFHLLSCREESSFLDKSMEMMVVDRGLEVAGKDEASVKGKYESHGRPASTMLTVNVSNVKLKASITNATFISGPSFNDLSLSIEKLSAFIINYNVPRKVNLFPLISLASFVSSSTSSCYFDSN